MKKQFPILLVDDDPLLLDILNRASRSGFPEATFHQVYKPDQAKDYINSLDGAGPKLILLDIDLDDKETGMDFLAFLSDHPQGYALAVVILTVSQLPNDIQTAYTLGANSFTTKPDSFEEWVAYFSALRLYWYETVTLPSIQFYKEP